MAQFLLQIPEPVRLTGKFLFPKELPRLKPGHSAVVKPSLEVRDVRSTINLEARVTKVVDGSRRWPGAYLTAGGANIVPTINVPLTWDAPAVAVIVTVVVLLTGKVFTANCTEPLPPGMNTNDGGWATPG